MITFNCDMCGEEIGAKELRYDLKISLVAAYDRLEITLVDLMHDHKKEYEELIRKLKSGELDPAKLEEDIHKEFEFHLCRACQQQYIKTPLPPADSDIKSRLKRRLDKE